MSQSPAAGTKKLFAYSAASGCLTNLLETSSFRNSLDVNNYSQVDSATEADVIFVNTCGYSDAAEKNSLDSIENFQNKFPDKKIIVSGCLPRINKPAIEKTFSGPIIASGDLHKMNELLNENIIQTSNDIQQALYLNSADLKTRLPSNLLVEKTFPLLKKIESLVKFKIQPLGHIFESTVFDAKTFAVSVSRGCLGKCNYCAIKKAKGKLVSRPLPEIISDIKKALDNGANKIHLLADDVGCWGQDYLLNSSHLLSAVLRLDYDFKVIINYFDPTWMTKLFDQLEEHLSNPKIICVNIPIQSGNNNIIRKMDRDYDIETVIDQVRRLKKNNPNLVAKTHIMVGYPNETHSEFQDSLAAVNEFDLIFANKFGARPNTPAEKLAQLSESTKNYRYYLLKNKIFIRHSKVFLKSILNLNAAH